MRKIIFSFVFLFSLCFTFAGKPKWLSSPEKLYPSSEYITAVGCGDNRNSSETAARFSLCQVLGEKISGVQNVFQSSDSNGSDFAKLDLEVQEKVLFEKIEGIKIKEYYSETEKIKVNGKKQKKEFFYALAVLKKSEAITYYSSHISQRSMEISSLQTKAEMMKSSSNPVERLNAVSLMKKAVSLAEENEYDVRILSAIQGMRQGVSYVSLQNVKNRLKDISEAIRISVSVSSDSSSNSEKISSQFQSVFKEFGFTITNASDFDYILKATLSFENVDGSDLAKNVRDGSEYKYVRYNLLSEFKTSDGKEILIPFNCSGREGHVSVSQAKNRSVQKICTKISENFKNSIEEYLNK